MVAVGGDEVAKGQVEIQKGVDRSRSSRSAVLKEYIEAKDDLLCREMFCRMSISCGSMRKLTAGFPAEYPISPIQKSFRIV